MQERRPILLVDDDSDMQDAVAHSLEALGFRVVTARHGAEALEKLKSIPSPCLVLLDLLMPVMDGREFLKRFRSDARLQSVPVVLMSANFDAQVVARQLRIQAMLPKPFTLEQLENLVKPYCRLEPALG